MIKGILGLILGFPVLGTVAFWLFYIFGALFSPDAPLISMPP